MDLEYRLLLEPGEEEERTNCMTMKVFSGTLFAINILVFTLISAWTLRFLRVFKLKKKLQLFFLLLVCLSSLGRVAYFGIELYWAVDDWQVNPPACLEGSVHWFSAAMFAWAVVANTFNWIYQTLRLDKFNSGIRRNQTGYHFGFAVSIVLEILVYIGLTLTSCMFFEENTIIFEIFGSLYAATFILVGIAFAIIGINFYRKFKESSPEIARKQRWRILASIIIIFIWFLLRGLNIIMSLVKMQGNETARLQFIEDTSTFMVLLLALYYIIVDIVPSLFLSFSIWLVTTEYKKRLDSLRESDATTEASTFTIDENSVVEDSFNEETQDNYQRVPGEAQMGNEDTMTQSINEVTN